MMVQVAKRRVTRRRRWREFGTKMATGHFYQFLAVTPQQDYLKHFFSSQLFTKLKKEAPLKIASGLHFIALLCLTSGVWFGAHAKCETKSDCCDTCPSGWTLFGGRCFLFQYGEKDWADAERFCTSLGGNLASLRTANEYTFIRNLIFSATNSHKKTWVGGYDQVKEGVWLWSDGSKFDFNGWAKGEPNNLGGEGCMEINLSGLDFVNDANCQQRSSFVCARNP